MKKTFFSMMTALFVAVLSLSVVSCQPTNTPDQPSTEDPTPENPEDPEPPIDESVWGQLNAEIKAFFGTTESIPEPSGEYEISVTEMNAGNDTWPSGIYSIGFRGSVLANYGNILKENGYTYNSANSQQGYDCYVGSGAYIIYVEQSGQNLMQVHKKSDVIK